MKNDSHPSASRSPASLNTAMADIVHAACQRTFALNAAMLDEMLVRSARSSAQTKTEPAGDAVPTWPFASSMWSSALPRLATAEQMWRYGASWLTICQWATASIANLLTAQSHGADAEVATISREVHDQVNEAAASAAAAAESVMSTGIAAVGRITDLATQAAAAVGSPTMPTRNETEAAPGGSRGRGGRPPGTREH